MFNNQFEDKPDEVQAILRELQKDCKVENQKLYKHHEGAKYIFPRPLERPDLIMVAHKAVGHMGLRKTVHQLQLHSAICHLENAIYKDTI
ncbi:hypothetical protein DSO57_1030094 [Entomophthora muscae]|uniref:Uncharacterized protein n=1 Tax=Entomophthora muscae TaxID=34485 RepID=A0ACC2T1Z2_9FUNG|nr:hypothetical protein DSO57_1030094 [Entomophthora muscae]